MVRASRKQAAVDDSPGAGVDIEPLDPVDRAPVHAGPRSMSPARIWLAASGIVVAVVHYWIADPQAGPRIFADEIGYLADARYLAGGRAIDMSHTAFYAGGFSVAITPLSRLFSGNPGHLYESIIVMQAVLAGVGVVLIAQICRWLFSTRWSVAIIAALVAGLYPAFVLNTGFTWAESMLTFALVAAIGSVVWLLRALDADRMGGVLLARAALVGCVCGYVVTIHNRTILAMLATVVLVASALVYRRALNAAVVTVAFFVVTTGAGQLLNRHLDHALWRGAGGVDTSGSVSGLVHPHGMWLASRAAIGQYWYQFVATGGVVAIALTGLALHALHTRRRADGSKPLPLASSRSTAAATIFVVFAALLVVSAVFLANGNRADTIVYGRYVDIATPLLVAVGITWLGTRPAAKSLYIAGVVVVGSTGAWLVLHFGARLELARPYNRVTTFAILGWLDPRRGGPMLFVPTAWAAAIALAGIALSLLVRRTSAPAWTGYAIAACGVAALFSWQLSSANRTVLHSLRTQASNTQATVRDVRATGDPQLALDPSITVVDRLGLAYWLPKENFVVGTPANATCSSVVSISRVKRPPAGEVPVPSRGALYLFRGVRSCPP